jgi:hypothetical protein
LAKSFKNFRESSKWNDDDDEWGHDDFASRKDRKLKDRKANQKRKQSERASRFEEDFSDD